MLAHPKALGDTGYEALLEPAFETLESLKLRRPSCTICYSGIPHMLASQKKMAGEVAFIFTLQFLSLSSELLFFIYFALLTSWNMSCTNLDLESVHHIQRHYGSYTLLSSLPK